SIPPNTSNTVSMLTTDLKGRLALITGATGGIGSATCRALAPLGCSIAIHYNSATSTAQSLTEELRNQGVQAEAFQADLREYAGVRELHKQVVEKMGNPDILFNNAGITMQSFTKDITDVPIEIFEETWRANCGSAFLLTQLCVPAMAVAGWGRVIFCGSVAGFTGGIVGPHYAKKIKGKNEDLNLSCLRICNFHEIEGGKISVETQQVQCG
ncbi:MAG: hypothetical protein Q9214_004805, partial [Letrouitia sp. 1 TL-2023]